MPFDFSERPERPQEPPQREHRMEAHHDRCALCGALGPALLVWPETPCDSGSAAAANAAWREAMRGQRYQYRRGVF